MMKNNPIHLSRRGLPLRRIVSLSSLLLLIALATAVFGSPALAQEPLEPPAPPQAENGLPLYENRCANCHGPAGQGDGELAANLPQPPRDFSDPEYLRNAVPATIYQTIVNGRLDAGMPPFGPASSNPIDSVATWDLVAAVYSLGTAPEAIEQGALVYQENCLACHGDMGLGDGPDAAGASAEVPDLTNLRYWANRSNEMVFASLLDTALAGHDYELPEQDLRDVVDFTRTFSYGYVNPQAAQAPIEVAVVRGTVINGSTGEPLDGGEVLLRAFTRDLQEADTMTADIGPDGSFLFELSDVSPDWVYLVSAEFGDLSFSSNPDRLDRLDPELDMPITVYETTSDPTAVNIDQVHMLLDFAGDRLLVSEIYVLSNRDQAVFVGASGNPDEGTLQLALPAGAENIEFQRSFRSFESFLPATEVIETTDGYADTVPVRPGEGAMNLLVSYDLPFEDGMSFEHPIFYEAANATAVLPDVGVELQGDGWTTQGSQQMGNAGAVLSYARPGLAAGDALRFVLDGRPAAPAAARVGSDGSPGGLNQTTALIIGGTVFLLTIGGAAYALTAWRGEEPVEGNEQVSSLLYAVVALDESYEAGELDEASYQKRRNALIEDLVLHWPSSGEAA